MEKIKIKAVEDIILEREASKICQECLGLINRDIDEVEVRVPLFLAAFVDDYEQSRKDADDFI
jgi:hypothetical protein